MGCGGLFIRRTGGWKDDDGVNLSPPQPMNDLLYLGAVAAFFLAGAAYTAFCGKL